EDRNGILAVWTRVPNRPHSDRVHAEELVPFALAIRVADDEFVQVDQVVVHDAEHVLQPATVAVVAMHHVDRAEMVLARPLAGVEPFTLQRHRRSLRNKRDLVTLVEYA